jgi:hypothetical protein
LADVAGQAVDQDPNLRYYEQVYFRHGWFVPENLAYHPAIEDPFHVERTTDEEPDQVRMSRTLALELDNRIQVVHEQTQKDLSTVKKWARMVGLADEILSRATEELQTLPVVQNRQTWEEELTGVQLSPEIFKLANQVDQMDIELCATLMLMPEKYWNVAMP